MFNLLKIAIPFLLIFFFVQQASKSSLLKIKNIYVYSEKEIPYSALINLSKETYFSLDSKKIKQELLKSDPEIENVEVEVSFPNTVSLSFTGRIPLALATESYLDEEDLSDESTPSGRVNITFNKRDDPHFLIDKSGVLFNGQNPENLPILGINLQNRKTGDRIEDIPAESMLQILQFLTKIQDIPLWISSLENKIIMNMRDGEMVIANTEDIEKEMSSLQLIRNRFRIEGRKVDYIDLRFGKPVVKYSSD